MLRSMTAYGRHSLSTPLGQFTVEIQSVNRKHLEINTLLPKELMRFDPDIRKIIGIAVVRGQVTVKLTAYFEKVMPITVMPNLPLVRQLKAAWDAIAKDLSLRDPSEFSLDLLHGEEGIFLYGENLQDEPGYRVAIFEVVEGALKAFLAMRAHEGEALQRDISSRLKKLSHWMDEIASRAGGATDKYRQKLLERLESLMPGIMENEERVLREICLYAERIDITEEITRFYSHLQQCEKLFLMEAGSIGKTFEFVLQELSREVNTIGSKSSDIEISRLVIEIKSELERMREQIQNIE